MFRRLLRITKHFSDYSFEAKLRAMSPTNKINLQRNIIQNEDLK